MADGRLATDGSSYVSWFYYCNTVLFSTTIFYFFFVFQSASTSLKYKIPFTNRVNTWYDTINNSKTVQCSNMDRKYILSTV